MSVRALQATGINKVELTEFPYPRLAEDAILLKVLYCGICGTDLHGIEGKRSLKFPVIPGHELVAEVAEIGPKALERIKVFAADTLNVGDTVTINPRIVCGKCYYCRNLPERPEMCMGARTYNSSIGSEAPPYLFGGWAEFMYILPDSQIIKLDDIDLEVASLIEPLACSVGLLDRYRRSHDWAAGDGFGVGRDVVLFGVGAIGLLAAACFRLSGAGQIICIDAVSERLELARKFGADLTLNVTDTGSDERIDTVKEACDGLGAAVVVEACGVPETIGEGTRMLRRGGQLFEMGHLLKTRPAEIDPLLICRNELQIIGNYAYPSSNCLARAAGILKDEKFPYRELIETYSLDDYQQALFQGAKSAAVKSVFKIQ